MNDRHDGLTTEPNKIPRKMEGKLLSSDNPMNPTVDPLDVHDAHDSHASTLWMSVTGASANDQHDHRPGADMTSVKVGHEPDHFNTTRIWLVPLIIAVATLGVYGVVQAMFTFVNSNTAEQKNIPSYNERATRIGTYDGKPIAANVDDPNDRATPAVAQPRLEYIRNVDLTRLNVKGEIVVDPPYLRSFKPAPTGNSPEIYPEDLRVNQFVDPTTGTRLLADAAWANKDKTIATLPIHEAIQLVTTEKPFGFKVAQTPSLPLVGTQGKPKLSSGGLTPPKPSDVKTYATKKPHDAHGGHGHDHKHDEKKDH